MTALTRFVLRHKALVALFWVAVAAAGVLDDQRHHPPDDQQLRHARAGLPGRQPDRPAVRQRRRPDPVRAGDHRAGRGGITDPAVAAATGRAFGALARAIPDVRIADYATTHNPAFVTRDGRSTFALVYTAPVNGFGGANLGPAIDRTLTAAAARGMARRGHRRAAAEQRPAVLGQGHRDHDRGDDRIGRLAGHPGPGVRQLPGAAAAGHRRYLGPGHVPAGRRADRGDRDQPDRRVPDRADRAGRGHRLLAAGGQPVAGRARRGPGQHRRRR